MTTSSAAIRDATNALLRDMADWTHTATLTFKPYSKKFRVRLTDSIAQSAVEYFLARLNGEVFRHGARRKRYRVASVVSFGKGAYGCHPHVHLILASPPQESFQSFDERLRRLSKLNYWIAEQADFQPYVGSRWLEYMADPFKHSILWDLCHQAKH